MLLFHQHKRRESDSQKERENVQRNISSHVTTSFSDSLLGINIIGFYTELSRYVTNKTVKPEGEFFW